MFYLGVHLRLELSCIRLNTALAQSKCEVSNVSGEVIQLFRYSIYISETLLFDSGLLIPYVGLLLCKER